MFQWHKYDICLHHVFFHLPLLDEGGLKSLPCFGWLVICGKGASWRWNGWDDCIKTSLEKQTEPDCEHGPFPNNLHVTCSHEMKHTRKKNNVAWCALMLVWGLWGSPACQGHMLLCETAWGNCSLNKVRSATSSATEEIIVMLLQCDFLGWLSTKAFEKRIKEKNKYSQNTLHICNLCLVKFNAWHSLRAFLILYISWFK